MYNLLLYRNRRLRSRKSHKSHIRSHKLLKLHCCPQNISTPRKHLSVKQKAWALSKRLPASPAYKVKVLQRMIKGVLQSPDTSSEMQSSLIQLGSTKFQETPKCSDSKVHDILQKITKYKAKKQYKKAEEHISILKSQRSLRASCKLSGMKWAKFQRLVAKHKELHANRRISQSDKNELHGFYRKTYVSFQLPYKRYSKYRYMRTTYKAAYALYRDEQQKKGKRVLRFSTFFKNKPKLIKPVIAVPYIECLCDTCVNFSLICQALRSSGMKGIEHSFTSNMVKSLCSYDCEHLAEAPDILQFRQKCVFRDCQDCGTGKAMINLRNMNEDVELMCDVQWYKWQNVELPNKAGQIVKKFRKSEQTGSLEDLLKVYEAALRDLPAHIYTFQFQARQFEWKKLNLLPGEIMTVMDFAQNYTHKIQQEAQSAHWHREQTTLHPIVTHYVCTSPGCKEVVRDEVVFVSSDRHHDGHAVHVFISKHLEHLRNKFVPVKCLIQWSDNCGVQYKSYAPFDRISRSSIPVIRNFFGAKHGKSEADGAIGRLVRKLELAAISDEAVVQNGKDIVEYCNKTYATNSMDGCQHFQRHFYYVDNIDRSFEAKSKSLYGTMKIHSIRNVGTDGMLQHRSLTCLCHFCMYAVGDHCGSKEMPDWTSVNIYRPTKSQTVLSSLNNKCWPQQALNVPADVTYVTLNEGEQADIRTHDVSDGSIIISNSITGTTIQDIGPTVTVLR